MDAFVPLTFGCRARPTSSIGANDIVVMDGVTTIVKVAAHSAWHSRMMFVRTYPRETQETVFDAHDRGVRILQGRLVGAAFYDNMKTAVETIFIKSARIGNTIAASRRCARITSSSRSLARRRRAGRRARSRTRSGSCASASSRRGYGSRAITN